MVRAERAKAINTYKTHTGFPRPLSAGNGDIEAMLPVLKLDVQVKVEMKM
jgi:hypothetical protein